MMIFTRSSSKSREAYHSIEKKESVTTIAARAIMVEVLDRYCCRFVDLLV
jgi:hypothetical protein